MINGRDLYFCLTPLYGEWTLWWLNIKDILAETWALVCSQALGDQIIFVTKPDKKKILFYNDKHCQFMVDEGEHKSAFSVTCDMAPSFCVCLTGSLHLNYLAAVGSDNQVIV